MKKSYLLLAVLGLALTVGVARASTISLIDVEMAGPSQVTAFSGQAATESTLSTLSTSNDKWNLITGYSATAAVTQSLFTSTGVATGVDFTVSAGATPTYNMAAGSTASALMDNYANDAGSSSSFTVTISNLNPSDTYDLYVYGNNGYSNSVYGKFTPIVGEGTFPGNVKGTSGGGPIMGYARPEDYIVWSASNGSSEVTPNALGTIAFTVTTNSGNAAILNGLQIVGIFPAAVPEPSSFVLAIAGVLGGAGYLFSKGIRRRAA